MAAASLQTGIEKGVGIPREGCPAKGYKDEPGTTQRLRQYLTAEVTTNHTDILLLSCCFVSGLVDSTIYNAYGTFVSMQTGALNPFLLSLPLQFSNTFSITLNGHPRQYRLPWSRWRHPPWYVQTIWLGEIPHLHHLLLHGMLLLLAHISFTRPSPPRRPCCILSPPGYHDSHCRSNYTGRRDGRISRYYYQWYRMEIGTSYCLAKFSVRRPDRW